VKKNAKFQRRNQQTVRPGTITKRTRTRAKGCREGNREPAVLLRMLNRECRKRQGAGVRVAVASPRGRRTRKPETASAGMQTSSAGEGNGSAATSLPVKRKYRIKQRQNEQKPQQVRRNGAIQARGRIEGEYTYGNRLQKSLKGQIGLRMPGTTVMNTQICRPRKGKFSRRNARDI